MKARQRAHSMLRGMPVRFLNKERELDDIQAIAQSGLFDDRYYESQTGISHSDGLAAVRHYVDRGATEGANPNRLFDGQWYLRTYPDAAASGLNPLVHFIRTGAALTMPATRPTRSHEVKVDGDQVLVRVREN